MTQEQQLVYKQKYQEIMAVHLGVGAVYAPNGDIWSVEGWAAECARRAVERLGNA